MQRLNELMQRLVQGLNDSATTLIPLLDWREGTYHTNLNR